MSVKEATARIKINKLLDAAAWRFFPDSTGPANICLEPSVAIKSADLTTLGDDFEKTGRSYICFEKRIQATIARVWGEDKPMKG
jgi:type I restriction enzyme R subunit